MYAIVKTGGKQYKVAPGDKICIEKMDAEPGSTVELPAICVVDGEKVEADPAKAAATKVLATVLEHYKGEKQLVFKFKKRKNYKKLRGHRQQLMRVHIDAVGSEKAAAPKKAAAKKADEKPAEAAEKKTAAKAEKPAEKKEAAKKPAAKKTEAKAAEKKPAAKKPAAKKTTAKKADEKPAE
ncbi:MAG: 50S ribosomal protein L21 [Eggerthellaceae bacterium]|jgi:large subunit ribosomal protein L21|nr:50S ribosomal protein L21 [Eggerthellaceae bacterium]